MEFLYLIWVYRLISKPQVLWEAYLLQYQWKRLCTKNLFPFFLKCIIQFTPCKVIYRMYNTLYLCENILLDTNPTIWHNFFHLFFSVIKILIQIIYNLLYNADDIAHRQWQLFRCCFYISKLVFIIGEAIFQYGPYSILLVWEYFMKHVNRTCL